MTSQTQKFIEMSDIIGLRFQCTHQDCGAVLLLSMTKPLEVKRLATCPHCNRPWLRTNGGTVELLLAECMEKLRTLDSELKGYKGISLMLEVKQEPKEAVPGI
jgi:hypothetical protein